MVERAISGLYLSQAYRDAWEDYSRSLKSRSFPVWDHVILTASNAHQAKGFEAQLAARKEHLPERTAFAVIPDEGNVRVGSGGATLSVLKYLREKNDSFDGKRILVIHSGGDSKRVPQYSALGKLFSPVPRRLPDGRGSTLFDELMIVMSTLPARIREGMLLLAGDVLLLFNPLLVDYGGRGMAAISFKEGAETGKNHGVYLCGENGNVRAFLHKQSTESLRNAGAVNENGEVDIDTGALIFGTDVMDALYGLICTEGKFDEEKYGRFVSDRVRLSLYGDFQYPVAEDSTLERFYMEKPEEEDTPELRECRTAVWEALQPFRMKLLRTAPVRFIHFGTTREILRLMNGEAEKYRALGWNARVNCSQSSGAGYYSVLRGKAGPDCYLEASYVHEGTEVGEGCFLSHIEIHSGVVIPPHMVLHGLKQTNGKFVCRIYGTDDNPKGNRLFGKTIPETIAPDLWSAPLYPECDTVREAVTGALALYDLVMSERWEILETWKNRKSLCSGFRDADPDAIIDWQQHMAELVQISEVDRMIDDGVAASKVPSLRPLTPVQRKWLEERLVKADYIRKMRLHYYAGTALGSEVETDEMFAILRDAILAAAPEGPAENTTLRIIRDSHSVSLPLRVNWGGGWSDTPPYCNENGGTVLNAAILLNGERPVKVTLRKLRDHKIVFESRDMNVYREFTDIRELQEMGDPFDAFVLQKAAILACGVIPAAGGNLGTILSRLGGGFLMDSEVTGVPKGSGLGTSSILAAACVKALSEFFGIEVDKDTLYSKVLCMEQMMSTGGGWQDQAGGLTDGIKYITSRPGLKQEISVQQVIPDEQTKRELNERFALIYTGQRRLARNMLRDVVVRYIGNEPDTVYALNEIRRVATRMRFELENGHVDDFATLLSEHWELSKKLDAGSTNVLIDRIFDAVDDLVDGKMVCGAGGGGFLQVVLKKGVTKTALQSRLNEVFRNTRIAVWDCTLL